MTVDGTALQALRTELGERLDGMRLTGVYKPERVMVSPQGTHVLDTEGRDVLNLCANNYLGLADDPRLVAAAQDALQRWGYGMASVRFICGTQDIHRDARAPARRVPRHRGRRPLRLLLRRQRRRVRGVARRA